MSHVYPKRQKVAITWRLRNIHDKMGGKSEGEVFIHAETSNHRAK